MRFFAMGLVSLLALAGCATSGSMQGAAANLKADATIVDIAVGNPDFSTLVAALKKADLVGALQGEGPFTVFAPTNDAFAKLPKEAVEALLADKEKLTQVLTYHVIPSRVLAADVVNLSEATTLQGSNVAISTENGVQINASNVVSTDIKASNGVIHVIDTVLMPQG